MSLPSAAGGAFRPLAARSTRLGPLGPTAAPKGRQTRRPGHGPRPADVVNFSTVHRAKGSEAERVWYVRTPLKVPRREWEEQQQRNLHYVALTRSKNVLAFVQPEKEEKDHD